MDEMGEPLWVNLWSDWVTNNVSRIWFSASLKARAGRETKRKQKTT